MSAKFAKTELNEVKRIDSQNVQFSDSDGRQTIKAVEIGGEKFIVVGQQFIAVPDLDKWIAAMQAAKVA